jgi:hypothetical protein
MKMRFFRFFFCLISTVYRLQQYRVQCSSASLFCSPPEHIVSLLQRFPKVFGRSTTCYMDFCGDPHVLLWATMTKSMGLLRVSDWWWALFIFLFWAPRKYFMLNGLEREECSASIFRFLATLILKMQAYNLNFVHGPLVVCEPWVGSSAVL